MRGVKIAHISDVHLGSVCSSLPYEKAKLRSKELIYTCTKAINNCAECDILLLSGDIFDSGTVPVSVIDQFLMSISELDNTQVFLSCGNHDSYYTDAIKYCKENSPDNLHIFPPDEITYVTLESTKSRIYGISFSSEHQYESLLKTMPKCDSNYINILCMHGDAESEQYNPFSIAELDDFNLDYVALGHIHRFDGIKNIGNCNFAYPGIIEGRGFDECGDKGYIKGTLYKGSNDLKFYPCAERIYIDETIDITDFKSEYDLIDVINSIGLSPENICRFNFVGSNNFGHPIDVKFIENKCKYFYCVCCDKTTINVSLEDYCGYPGLLGACANETKKMIDTSEDAEQTEMYRKSFEILRNAFENR